MIRTANDSDLPILRDIERAAGRCFAHIGMHAVADDEPPSLETLREFRSHGHAWVYTSEGGTPIAYTLVSEVDGNAHLEQVSVHPDHAGQRIGKALIDATITSARACGFSAMTLTTFTDVAWNGPYYARLGFRYIPQREETPGLRSIRAAEATHGLDQWRRACMRIEWSPSVGHPETTQV